MALSVAEVLVQDGRTVAFDEAKQLFQGLSQSQAEEVLQERSLTGACAAPWCLNPPIQKGSGTVRFQWDSLRSRFVDLHEFSDAPPAVPKFCSKTCANASKPLVFATFMPQPDAPSRSQLINTQNNSSGNDAASAVHARTGVASKQDGDVVENEVYSSEQVPPRPFGGTDMLQQPADDNAGPQEERERIEAMQNPQEHAAFMFTFAAEGAGTGGVGVRTQKYGGQEGNPTAMEQFAVGELSRNLPSNDEQEVEDVQLSEDKMDAPEPMGIATSTDDDTTNGRSVASLTASTSKAKSRINWADPLSSAFQSIVDDYSDEAESLDDDLEDTEVEPQLLSPFARICSLLSDICSEAATQYLALQRDKLPKASHPPSAEWQSSFEQSMALALPPVMRKLEAQTAVLQRTIIREISDLVAASSPRRALPGLGTRYA